MKKIIVRSITGAIYVGATIAGIFIHHYAFLLLFAILLVLSLSEFYQLSKKDGKKPLSIPAIVLSLYTFIVFFFNRQNILDDVAFLGIIPLFFIIPVIELLRKSKTSFRNLAYTFFGLVYITLPFVSLTYIAFPLDGQPDLYMDKMVMGLFIILWSSDTGAYLIGSCIGKHKMAPKISPKKTWEGAIGGLFVALIVSIIVLMMFYPFSYLQVVVITVVTVITGTMGDLTESIFKRSIQVKDSGNILPGHGGILDRLDSMFFAAPFYLLTISLILNIL